MESEKYMNRKQQEVENVLVYSALIIVKGDNHFQKN